VDSENSRSSNWCYREIKMKRIGRSLRLGALLALGAAPLSAQQPAAPPPAPLAVGVLAPDFELSAATSAGVTANRLRLTDLRGKIVVIAFFFRARTSG
jgi:cytochrome oxidase Cu insertion factor (SCO1/SenC/PrrC family)